MSVRGKLPDGIIAKYALPTVLAIATLISRILCRGDLYFADGLVHIRAITDQTYIIQPPGYWLFNRFIGLFAGDPVRNISVLNILFSVAAVVVFYYLALFFTGQRNAFLASLAYSSIFYLWFSGEVHSTYASQALFPIAFFLTSLHYERKQANWKLVLAAILFAVGAGFRPSDGAFLLPLIGFYAIARLPRIKAILFLSCALLLCLGWIIPTELAYSRYYAGFDGVISYLRMITSVKSVTKGVNSTSIANMVRYFLPMITAFLFVLHPIASNLIRNWKDWRVRAMLVWILPGSLFFIFICIYDAPYLNLLTAPFLLLAVSAPRRMMTTALWNSLLFLSLAPIPSTRLAVNIWNCDVVKFSLYGIRHQWWPNLSDVQKGISQSSPLCQHE